MDSVQFLAPLLYNSGRHRGCVCVCAGKPSQGAIAWLGEEAEDIRCHLCGLFTTPRKSYSRLLAGEGWGGQVAKPQLSSRVETCV